MTPSMNHRRVVLGTCQERSRTFVPLAVREHFLVYFLTFLQSCGIIIVSPLKPFPFHPAKEGCVWKNTSPKTLIQIGRGEGAVFRGQNSHPFEALRRHMRPRNTLGDADAEAEPDGVSPEGPWKEEIQTHFSSNTDSFLPGPRFSGHHLVGCTVGISASNAEGCFSPPFGKLVINGRHNRASLGVDFDSD